MLRIGLTEVRNVFHDTIRRVQFGGERVILERQGRPVAALVSIEDLELLEQPGGEDVEDEVWRFSDRRQLLADYAPEDEGLYDSPEALGATRVKA